MTPHGVLPVIPVCLAEILQRVRHDQIPIEISLRSISIIIIIIYIVIIYTYPLQKDLGIGTML